MLMEPKTVNQGANMNATLKRIKDTDPQIFEWVTAGYVRADGKTVIRMPMNEALAILRYREEQRYAQRSPEGALWIELLGTLHRTLAGLNLLATREINLPELFTREDRA